MRRLVSRLLIIFFLYTNLLGCASGEKMVFHSVSFDANRESPDVDVLDWRYGGDTPKYDAMLQSGIRADRDRVKQGLPIYSSGTAGVIPIGDFLYVKWRVKGTGAVHEDTVDLKKILPHNIEYHAIHFAIRVDQLYVYLVPPRHGEFPVGGPGVWDSSSYLRMTRDPIAAEYVKKCQIYPTQ